MHIIPLLVYIQVRIKESLILSWEITGTKLFDSGGDNINHILFHTNIMKVQLKKKINK